MSEHEPGVRGPGEPQAAGPGAPPPLGGPEVPQAASQGAPSGSFSARHTLAFLLVAIGSLAIAIGVGSVAVARALTAASPVASVSASGTSGSSGGGIAGVGGGWEFLPPGSAGTSGSSSAAAGAPANVSGVAAKVSPALVDINSSLGYQSARAAGTGIVVTSDGEVLTNNHVIAGATKLTATDVGNGKTYAVTVLGYDPTRDLAVLKLQGASGLTTATLGDSSKLAIGQAVVGIGNAGGVGGTPSSAGGAITGLGRTITVSDESGGDSQRLAGLIETNAAIEAGDSGGPLVNAKGEVIGIDTAGSAGSPFASAATDAYAIPINRAVQFAEQVVAGKRASTAHLGETAFLGVSVASESSSASQSGGFGGFGDFGPGQAAQPATASGITVAGVISGLSAEKAGLAAGDVITSFGGKAIRSRTQLERALLPHHPGDKVAIRWIDTAGGTHTATVTLTSGPPA